MGKLLVTLFAFLPAGRQVLLLSRQISNAVGAGHPTSQSFVGQSAHLPAIKFLHHDKFLAP
jgi:hypothetical protein